MGTTKMQRSNQPAKLNKKPKSLNACSHKLNIVSVGVSYGEGPPVPIPNTEVKLTRADNTWLVTAREDRYSPTHIFLLSSVGRARGC